ncbi:MAG: hypothetical protein JXJ22_17145 [Bacteroidales bacterium]|nr:hypothetical protein [Bacteroidales bacterium]
MNKKPIRFAMAVNHASHFEAKHFGDADKYLIFEWSMDELHFLKEEINAFKNLDEKQEHGLQKKGKAIIDLLQNLNIKVLVSRQFGKNIQMVNSYFIPVIVYKETAEDVGLILKKHIKWIEDEIANNPEEHKLFTIKNGILKTTIRKDD